MSLNTILATAPLTTTNYILKATGTTIGNSSIFDNGTNVGIGNTNTSYTLDVSGTGRFTSTLLVSGAATFSSTIAATSGTFTVDDAATNSVLDILTLTHTTSGTAASGLGAGILFRTERPSGGITLSRGAIYGVSGTDADDDGDLAFYTLTDTGGSGFSEKMRINAAGNVGIGTTSITNGTTFGGGGQVNRLKVRSGNYTCLEINGSTSGGSLQFTYGTDLPNQVGGILAYNYGAGGSLEMNLTNITNGPLYLGTNNTTRMTILAGGNTEINNSLSVGTTIGSNVRLTVQGGDSTGSNYAIDVKNSTTTMFFVRNDGYMYFGLSANSPYNIAQSGRTCILASNGSVGYLSSTRESKTNIESIKNIDFINQLNAVQFNYRKKDEDTNQYTDEYYDNITYGFIADEVEKVNKELVFYNNDNTTLAGVDYNSIIAILTKAVQELKAEIDELKNK